MKKYLYLIAVLFCTVTAEARLGETSDQCIERYGQPVIRKDDYLIFKTQSGIVVKTIFKAGRCVCIVYRKADEDFTEEQLSVLLKSNTGNGDLDTWKLDENIESKKQFMGSWKTYKCLFYGEDKMIIITTSDVVQQALDDGKQEERKAVEGL